MVGFSSFCFHTEWANFEDALDMFSEMLASDEKTAQSAHLELVNKWPYPKNGMHQEVTNIVCCKLQEAESAPSPTKYLFISDPCC